MAVVNAIFGLHKRSSRFLRSVVVTISDYSFFVFLAFLIFFTFTSTSFSADIRYDVNNLKNARSPYLRKAALQHVPWQEWSEEVLAEAKRLDRPVIIDIGAYWCFWCRRMDADTYSDPAVASIIKEKFIAIKVDRDEMPELDERYQGLMSVLNFQTGWPLTVIMTPEGLPFYGGTYFPPDSTDKLQGFKEVLNKASVFFKENRSELKSQVSHFIDIVSENRAAGIVERSAPVFQAAVDEVISHLDKVNGGFTLSGPVKFPRPAILKFLLRYYFETGKNKYLDAVSLTLEKMAEGAVFDHAEGGFHRYSETEDWSRPHFEKMLTDNAMFSSIYLSAYRFTGNEYFRDVALQTLGFMDYAMKDNETGAFYSSIAAGSADEPEGYYYSFTKESIDNALSADELDYFYNRFKLIPIEGRKDEKRFLIGERSLFKPYPETERMIKGYLKLMRSRGKRPETDTSVYSDANAFAVISFLDAYKATGNKHYRDTALKAMEFLLSSSFTGGKGFSHLPSSSAGSGRFYLKDQAVSGIALIECYGVTGNEEYLNKAEEIARLIINSYYDNRARAFLSFHPSPGEKQTIYSVPSVDVIDADGLSGNAIALSFINKIYLLTEDTAYSKILTDSVPALRETVRRDIIQTIGLAEALYDYEFPSLKAVIVFRKGDRESLAARDELAREVLMLNYPETLIYYLADGAEEKTYSLPADIRAMLYPCIGTACYKPISDPAQVKDDIREIIKK